jgi:hypothetical protein
MVSALTGRQLLGILLDLPDADLDLTVFVDALGDQVIGGDAVAVFHEPDPGRIAIVSRSALTHHRNDPQARRLDVVRLADQVADLRARLERAEKGWRATNAVTVQLMAQVDRVRALADEWNDVHRRASMGKTYVPQATRDELVSAIGPLVTQ